MDSEEYTKIRNHWRWWERLRGMSEMSTKDSFARATDNALRNKIREELSQFGFELCFEIAKDCFIARDFSNQVSTDSTLQGRAGLERVMNRPQDIWLQSPDSPRGHGSNE